MKSSKYTLFSLLMLVLVAAVYRVIPDRPWGFAPQFAMTLFCGATIKDKRIALALPLISMFISDMLYQVLYVYGISGIEGFYAGMVWNYLLFGSLTFIGFFVNQHRIASLLKGAFATPTAFFILSNFVTWLGGGGLQRPKTGLGLLQTYADGLPFYGNSLVATVVFGLILFGSNHLMARKFAVERIN